MQKTDHYGIFRQLVCLLKNFRRVNGYDWSTFSKSVTIVPIIVSHLNGTW